MLFHTGGMCGVSFYWLFFKVLVMQSIADLISIANLSDLNSMEGFTMAAELVECKVVNMPAMKLVGKEIRCTMGHPQGNPIPAFWGRCFAEGLFAKLQQIPHGLYPQAFIGWMGRFTPADQTWSYIVGMLFAPEATVPEGLEVQDIPATTCAVGTMQGTEPEIFMQAHDKLNAEMKARNLTPDSAAGFAMEWYDERYNPQEQQRIIDYYEPIQA